MLESKRSVTGTDPAGIAQSVVRRIGSAEVTSSILVASFTGSPVNQGFPVFFCCVLQSLRIMISYEMAMKS